MRVEHIRGRILEFQCASGEGELRLFSVHTYDIGNQEMRKVASALHDSVSAHSAAPHSRRAVLMGDLNLGPAHGGGTSAARRRGDRALDSALNAWVESPTGGATHVSPAGGGHACIDRV